MRFDVIVVGGGPAGCAAAISLGRRGVRVLLLERAGMPQHKTCGDGLLPDALRALDELGLAERVRGEGLSLETLEVTAARGEVIRLAVSAVTLRRQRLHALLQEEAGRRGVELLQAEAAGPLLEGERVVGVLARSEKSLSFSARAPLVILASGARPGTLRDFGVCLREQPSAVGIRAYFRDLSGEFGDALRISYQRSLLPGYGWVFPLPDGIYNIGCGWFFTRSGEQQPDLGKMFEHFLCTFLPARLIAGQEEMLGTPCGGLLRTGLAGARSHRAGLLVAGEAVGATLPWLGEGVGKALNTGLLAGRIAAEALATGDFSEAFLGRYAACLEELYRLLYHDYERAQRWLARAGFSDLLARQVGRRPALRRAMEGVLSEALPPRAVFSLAGLLGWRQSKPAGAHPA